MLRKREGQERKNARNTIPEKKTLLKSEGKAPPKDYVETKTVAKGKKKGNLHEPSIGKGKKENR